MDPSNSHLEIPNSNKPLPGGRRFTALFCSLFIGFLCAGPAAPCLCAETKPEGKPHRNYGKGNIHRAFMNRIQKGDPITLLFLGDSITQGWPNVGADTWEKFAAHRPANFGAGGENTDNLLYRLTTGELDIKPNPKVVVLMIGVNNISQNKHSTPESVAAGVKRNLEVIREKVPDSKVILMSLMPFGQTLESPVRKKVVGTNKIIKDFADGKNILYVDVYSKMIDSKGVVHEGYMDTAFLHPTEKGYQAWHEVLSPVIEPLLK